MSLVSPEMQIMHLKQKLINRDLLIEEKNKRIDELVTENDLLAHELRRTNDAYNLTAKREV